jgi:predicted metal-dependent TIM-barrel fold hydrolase
VKYVMDSGMWGGLTLYPESKCTSPRAIDILEAYGADRLWMNSACDWGVSVPLAVPYAAQEMRRRGYDDETVDEVFFKNPVKFLSQCENFTVHE